MALNNERISILIFGPTGDLGSSIARHSLANPKLLVNIFVRDPTKIKDLAAEVKAKGGKVFVGDVNSTELLNEATKNIHTVVFAIGVSDEQLFKTQLSLIDISVKNKVKRFAPSEFGINTPQAPKDVIEKIPPLDFKYRTGDYLEKQPIAGIYFYNGAFETYFTPIFGDFKYYGDSSKIDVIAFEDLGKLVANGLSDEHLTGKIFFTGHQLTIEEAAEIHNRVKETKVQAKKEGSIEDLHDLFQAKLKLGLHIEGLLLGLRYLVLSGSQQSDSYGNEKYQNFTQTPVEDIFKRLK